jgi:MEDS: MEthanogen/methylotroph, DcmR Sensory domain
MAEVEKTGRLAGSGLDRYRHVCVLYHSMDEEFRVLQPFIKDGFQKGDKAFHIIDERHRTEHLRRLRDDLGIDVAATEQIGQLEVRGWEQAHLRPGWFDQHAMLALVEEVLTDTRRRGFPFTRWVANMGWALGGHKGVEDLVEYCTRLNEVTPRHEATIICTYDLAQFSATSVIDVLRSHPVAVIGGMVHENPFYIPPDELLRELRQRQGSPPSGRAAAAVA